MAMSTDIRKIPRERGGGVMDEPQAGGTTPAEPPVWRHPRVLKGALGLAAAGIALLAVWWLAYRPYVTTDDARIAAPVASVAPSGAGGRIERVLVREGDRVRAGDPLVLLDPGAQVAQVARAKALLAIAESRGRP